VLAAGPSVGEDGQAGEAVGVAGDLHESAAGAAVPAQPDAVNGDGSEGIAENVGAAG
jgi:hypothetical protein